VTVFRGYFGLLLVLFMCAAGSAQPAAVNPPSFEERLSAIAAYGIRAENSAVERAVISYIEESLRAAGLTPRSGDFSSSRGGYSASRILDVLIPGALPAELIFIAPLNSWHDASSGGEGAAGLAFALNEAERIAASGTMPPLSLRFVFLGAERRGREGKGEAASLGSRTWIAATPSQAGRAVVYLDLDAACTSLSIDNAGERKLSPLWLYDRVRTSIEKTGLRPDLKANRTMLYRLGLADRYGPAAPYLAAGIPALQLSGRARGGESAVLGRGRENAAPISGASLSRFIDLLISANAEGFPDTWDFHYLTFEIGGISATIRETEYVAFIVALSAVIAAIVLILSVARRATVKPLISRMPLVIGRTAALYAALTLVILAGNAVSRFDALALGSEEAWLLAPRVFVAARLISSLLLYLVLVSLLVERRAFSANPYAYEFSALFCLVIDVFVFSAVNLPVSLPFIWAFLIVVFSLTTRKGAVTIFANILMYAPLAPLAVELAMKPERAVFDRILNSGLTGAFALAAFSLPFYAFTTSPFLFVAPRGAPARKKMAAILAVSAVLIEALALVVAAQAGMPGLGKRLSRGTEVTIGETIDQDRGRFEARLRGTRRLGSGILSRGALELEYATSSDEALLSGTDSRRLIGFSVVRAGFLDRRTETIKVAFEKPPFIVRLSLRGAEELRIYDCDLPCRVSLDGKSAEIFAAVNPGTELGFSLTVPRGFAAELLAEAEYLAPLEPYAFPDGSLPEPGSFSVRATTSLRAED
jgi:hypothetical protein